MAAGYRKIYLVPITTNTVSLHLVPLETLLKKYTFQYIGSEHTIFAEITKEEYLLLVLQHRAIISYNLVDKKNKLLRRIITMPCSIIQNEQILDNLR